MKIYVVLNTKVGKYDAILYHKDIHVLVSSCVNFCFAHGPIFANSIIKNDFNCISLRQIEIKCMCIAMLISLQFIVFCETEITQ